MRSGLRIAGAFVVVFFAGCGYHTVGSPTHLPSTVHTLAVPLFRNNSQSFHAEVAMTQAVAHEFSSRTKLAVLPNDDSKEADATVKGTILTQTVVPLTYNSSTGQSSSYLITITASVAVLDRDNRVLYSNKNYLFRQQYQSSSDLPSFFEEDPAAVARLSRDFARTLVSDILESL